SLQSLEHDCGDGENSCHQERPSPSKADDDARHEVANKVFGKPVTSAHLLDLCRQHQCGIDEQHEGQHATKLDPAQSKFCAHRQATANGKHNVLVQCVRR